MHYIKPILNLKNGPFSNAGVDSQCTGKKKNKMCAFTLVSVIDMTSQFNIDMPGVRNAACVRETRNKIFAFAKS